ncbi:MAG TPA: RNA methyltransferase [Acidimicrobiales bacterium]|nr:RNA methyltransferase [Acidimicrobiales bacterium]
MGPLVAIGDPADPRVDDYRNLTDAELRQRIEPAASLFMVEGPATIRQLLVSSYPVRSLLLTEHRLAELRPELVAADGDWPVYVAATEVLRAITGFRFHRGALAAARRPPAAAWREVATGPLLVVAEGIGDHENMGALFRNAAAFGVDAILLSPSAVDPLYRRAVRVSMGHVLRVPWARLDPWPAALDDLRAGGHRLLALTPAPEGRFLHDVRRPTEPIALLVGAEGPGLSSDALARADERVRIPMASGVDSLNVATAAAVALHALTRLQ